MLDFQLTQYPFRLGLAEGTDPRQVPPGTLVTAENCVWKQSGRLEKRFAAFGFSRALAGGGSMASATRLFARGTDLCIANPTGLYSLSTGAGQWRLVGALPDASPTWTTMIDDAVGVAAADARLYANFLVQAWVQGDPTGSSTNQPCMLYVRVVDQVTGTVVMAPTNLGGATNFMGVRVLVLGSKAYVISRLGSAAPYSILGFIVDLTSFAVTTVTMKADVGLTSAESGWDAAVVNGAIVIAYNQTGGNVRLASFNAALGAVTAATIAAGGCEMVSICGTSLIYVLYSASGATPRPVKIATANATTLALISGPTTIETPATGSRALSVSVCEYDASNCVVAYQIYTGLNELYLATAKVSSAAVVATTTYRKSPWLTALTRPFMLNGRCYIGMVDTGPPLPSASTFTGYSSGVAEIEFTDTTGAPAVPLRLVGKVDDLVGSKLVTSAPRPEPIAVSSTQVLFPLPYQSSVPSSVTNWRCGVRLVSLDVGATRAVDWGRAITVGQEAYIAGSGLTAYDGSRAFDYGFFRGPQIDGSTTATVGGSMVAGTYLYGAVQEYRSQTGMLYRSPTAVGVALAVASGVTGKITVNVDGFSTTNKQGLGLGFAGNAFLPAPTPTLLPIFRSTVGGTVYQRLSYEPTYNVLDADASQTFVTYSDVAADADITHGVGPSPIPLAARPAIYTTGGILPDEQPPASVTMFHHADRLWVLTGDRRTWWHTKAFQDDLGVAPGFSASFRFSFDDAQTAGGTMDDKAIFFSAAGVRYMLGTGPAPNGQNSDFQGPFVIQSDVGCTSARSVVGTPDGIMFLSARGLYLLTRGLELVWIGRPVQNTLAAFPVVTSAVLVATSNQVRFTCNAADGLSGVVLVYDYVEKQWSTFKYTDTVTGTYGCPIADACMWLGAWTFVTPGGAVYGETQSSYLDNGTAYVPMTLETAWISAAGPLAFQSVREFSLHGTSYTDHDLTVSIGFDSDPSYPQTHTFPATGAVTGVGDIDAGVIVGTRRKCSTIRFKIVDATPSAGVLGIGRGPAFDMMGLEVGVKKGFRTTPATKRA